MLNNKHSLTHSLYTSEENKVNVHSLGVKQQTLNHSLYTSEVSKVNLHSLGVTQQTLNHSLYNSITHFIPQKKIK